MEQVDEQLGIITRSTEEILPLEDLKAKLTRSLKEKTPLTVKFGVDPTSPDLHLGHAVILRKLKTFQELGHRVVLLIGDFTARIGDPSERSVTRPQLGAEQVRKNAKTYTDQAFKILDRARTVIDYNSRWFGKMTFEEILKLSAKFTVAQMLVRDDFGKRYSEGFPIGLHEFLYPVMQAYDSIVLHADIEIGGTDQIFNMLAGRDLQRESGQEPQVVITMPILEGIDGKQKMSKSLGNHVGLTDPPEEMFGKIMSVPDELMIKYFYLTTDLLNGEIEQINQGLEQGTLHPAKAKRRLAREVVTLYHGHSAAEWAEREFDTIFKEKELPSQIPEVLVSRELLKDKKIWIVRLITSVGFAKTGSEARRLIQQGGVKLNGKVIQSPDIDIEIKDGYILQVGKRKFTRLKLS
ncbi:MAG: tyrosine--tRNA ligase [Actinomycetota bacterium]|nr:tyrosine--tRNA ligase [Actinomycetota bacterium]